MTKVHKFMATAGITGLASLALSLGIACASGRVPLSEGPIDWQAVTERWSIHIVTLDPDGDERVTRIWLGLVGGEGTIRTGDDNRWWLNLERNPNCRIRVLGVDYPVRAESIVDHEARARIDDAFAEKYGWFGRMMFPQERGETHENYARLESRGGR